jgi:hypothetical protein|eukprot:COSAG06_NODE_2691_length_6430_cov_2.427648_5_plen_43_part_00
MEAVDPNVGVALVSIPVSHREGGNQLWKRSGQNSRQGGAAHH